MTEQREKELRDVERRIQYAFHNRALLNMALTHSSFINENKSLSEKDHNQRLEFLGDAVMQLIITDYLYHTYDALREGSLTKVRAQIVCEKCFAHIARLLDLGTSLLMGKGEAQSGGRNRDSVLADTFEAVIGAMYLDAGFERVHQQIVDVYFTVLKEEIKKVVSDHDYKTMLQELSQKKNVSKLRYNLVDQKGPDHDKVFYMEVSRDGRVLGRGVGKNKKSAEQDAARAALIALGEIDE